MSTDPYKTLGVSKTSTKAEIKKAYRKIARKSHPDLNPGDAGAEARFKAALAAYDLLKDPEIRARFDRGEIDASGAEKPQRHYYRDYADAPGHGYHSARGYEDLGDVSDLFAEMLRQRGAEQGPQARNFNLRGADQHYALTLKFLDAVRGSNQRLTFIGGQNLEVKIPPGTSDGQIIRLAGKGGAGSGEGSAGDALIKVTVQPHRFFQRDGNDILLTLPISIDEAILGGKVEAPTIDGPVGLTIPPGASSGQVMRLRQRGIKPKGANQAGDQRVTLRINAPEKIDDRLKDFMTEWKIDNGYNPREGILK